MSYGKRIDTLCSLLIPSATFADVGCDHGYCSEYVLKNQLCEKVYFSDVSKGSLAKAQALLAPYVADESAVAVLGDGFYGVPNTVEQVLIAGMGGSEIVAILSHKKFGFMPKRFVFQPMHDSEKLRRYLLENGGYIERDFTFQDVKFYDVIVGGKADETHKTQAYSDAEYEFGRENLRVLPEAFVKRTKKQIANVEKYLRIPSLQEASKEQLTEKKKKLEGALQGETW